MATIIVDDQDSQENGNPTPVPDAAEVTNSAPRSTPAPETPPAEEDIPEKFRGKKLAEILKSYEDMEKLVGRQGAELGELRKTHDEVIRSFLEAVKSNQANNPKQDSEDDDTEFFTNPRAAIERAIAKHPEIQRLQQAERQRVADRALGVLAKKHPDFREILTSREFVEFVSSHPIHAQLLQQADRNYDVAAADYVLSQFKASRASAAANATVKDATEAARKAAVSASKVPAGTATHSQDGGKPIYRRAELVRKMQTDPDWYAAHADEIYAAYAEGRVR